MIFEDKPDDFDPKLEAVGCFVESDGEILLLHRQDHKPQGDTWGIPSGKIDDGEKPAETIVREVTEETGISVPIEDILLFKKIFVKYPTYDFVYYIFLTKLDGKANVKINPKEHKDFRWVSPEDGLRLPGIEDLDACIKLVYKK